MKIFGRRKLWWLTQFAKFQYRVARGDGLTNSIFGKFKVFFTTIMTLGTGEIVVKGWLGISLLDHIPPWILVAIPIGALISDYLVGLIDEKWIKFMHIESEIKQRRGLDLWQKEMMERIKNIEKEVSPKEYKEIHESFIVEGKKQRKVIDDNGGK